jgi:FkbM family methyltransferase
VARIRHTTHRAPFPARSETYPKNPMGRRMSVLFGLKSIYRLFGPRGAWLTAISRVLDTPITIVVTDPCLAHPFHLRLRTTDVSLFEEIILNSEYALPLDLSPRTIVDAGANIGLSSLFFANAFPTAQIVAIEPESSNFALLQQNAHPYPSIRPFLGALWSTSAPVCLQDPGTGNWGYRVRTGTAASEPSSIPAITVDALMQQLSWDHIDILKIDIEGSEKEVFEGAPSWIDRVGILIIELHDRLTAGCSRSVYGATQGFDLEWCKGETRFFFRRSALPDTARGLLKASAPSLNSQGIARRTSRILSAGRPAHRGHYQWPLV